MEPQHIVFLLFPHSHLMDLSGAAQVFYEANAPGRGRFRLSFASAEPCLPTEQGLHLANLTGYEHLMLGPGDMVCVPGIDFGRFCRGDLDASIEKTAAWLRRQREKGVFIASVCSGALILAQMGLLDGVRCTTHWKCLDYARAQFPRARFVDDRLYIFDRDIFTSAGMTAGIDMALSLVEKWSSPLVAARIAQEMVINVRRAETRDQRNIFLDFQNHFNADVYRAQEILANHLEASFTVKCLAKILNRSSRQLARLFRQHTGQTIQDYRDHLRLERGRQLLRNTELSVKEIAGLCGFGNTRQFARLWKKKTGRTPGESRGKTG
jgi:transcriptional regulator GlxA family with amidase domain